MENLTRYLKIKFSSRQSDFLWGPRILCIILFLFMTFKFASSDNQSVKIDVWTQSTTVKSWQSIEVTLRISNTSNSLQNIGAEVCGVHGVNNNLITNNKFVYVQGTLCFSNILLPQEVILKPGEVYKQDCTLSFDKQKIKSGPFNFRIGLKSMKHLSVWSNDIVINVE